MWAEICDVGIREMTRWLCFGFLQPLLHQGECGICDMRLLTETRSQLWEGLLVFDSR